MDKFLVILLIVQAAFVVSSIASVEYIKTDNLRLSLQSGGLHDFYEAEFTTRVDHFRPLNQQRVNFVQRLPCSLSHCFCSISKLLSDLQCEH